MRIAQPIANIREMGRAERSGGIPGGCYSRACLLLHGEALYLPDVIASRILAKSLDKRPLDD